MICHSSENPSICAITRFVSMTRPPSLIAIPSEDASARRRNRSSLSSTAASAWRRTARSSRARRRASLTVVVASRIVSQQLKNTTLEMTHTTIGGAWLADGSHPRLFAVARARPLRTLIPSTTRPETGPPSSVAVMTATT